MNTKQYKSSKKTLSLLLASAMMVPVMVSVPSNTLAQAKQYSNAIRLFTPTVRENLKESKVAAQTMERNLQSIIADMEQQLTLYKASKCEGAEPDSGCQQQLKQLGESYLHMASEIEIYLPDIQKKIANTYKNLEKNIRSELGRSTVWDIQNAVLNNGSSQIAYKSRKRGMGLSARFDKLLKITAVNRGRGMETQAAETYLDLYDASNVIEQIQLNITNARLQLESGMDMLISDDMITTVGGVKALLFGDIEDALSGAIDKPELPENPGGVTGKFLL